MTWFLMSWGLNLFDLRNSSTPFAEIEKYKNAQIIIKCIKIQIDYTVVSLLPTQGCKPETLILYIFIHFPLFKHYCTN